MILDYKNIYLIDDDAIVNRFNRKLIENTKLFEAIEFSLNPSKSLIDLSFRIDKNDKFPGLIMIDLSMPEMNGFEFIDELDELFEAKNLINFPIFIILTSSTYKRDVEQFLKTPSVKRFLTKPLKIEEFNKILKELNI